MRKGLLPKKPMDLEKGDVEIEKQVDFNPPLDDDNLIKSIIYYKTKKQHVFVQTPYKAFSDVLHGTLSISFIQFYLF